MKRLRAFLQDNALMVSGMLLMLASAGIDGKFLSMWMSEGMAWLGYVLNLVADATSYVISNAYGRLQDEEDDSKRKLSRLLLVGEFVGIAYSWLFGYLVLRERFVVIFTRPIFGALTTEREVLAFVSAGFVPLMLTLLGYADSLNKTQPRARERASSTDGAKPGKATAAPPAPVAQANSVPTQATTLVAHPDTATATPAVLVAQPDTASLPAEVRALIDYYASQPLATQSEAGSAVARSRQWVGARLAELEEAGVIHRNGNGVEILG